MKKINGTLLGILVIIVYFSAQIVEADEIKFGFKNPSFSGA